MKNLQGKAKEDWDASLGMIARSDIGRVFLAGLENDLKVLDQKNRIIGSENQIGAALYLAWLFEEAGKAGYKSAYPHLAESMEPSEPVNPTPRARVWTRIFSAFKGTVR